MKAARQYFDHFSHIYKQLNCFTTRIDYIAYRSCSSGVIKTKDNAVDKILQGKLSDVVNKYEVIVGLKEVKAAQDRVIQAETSFIEAQKCRHEKQLDMRNIQEQLRNINNELEKVKRGDERYIDLLTREHDIIRLETALIDELKLLEEQERTCFSGLSAAVRASHEKERAHGERTKYWSIIGSAIGAAIGIVGTTINNRIKLKELRNLVKESAASGAEFRVLIDELSYTVKDQQENLSALLGADTTVKHTNDKITTHDLVTLSQFKTQCKDIVDTIHDQKNTLKSDIAILTDICSQRELVDSCGNIVRGQDIIKAVIADSEMRSEYCMKWNTIVNVSMIYGAFALTLPILYVIFKGSG